ncbi:MAG: hypothetical protein ABL986_08600 [Vicinamibacterales bacterium]
MSEQRQAFFGQREEDVVLGREVAVDGGGLYSTLAAMLRIDTLEYPSTTKSSSAASRMARRVASRNCCWRSWRVPRSRARGSTGGP